MVLLLGSVLCGGLLESTIDAFEVFPESEWICFDHMGAAPGDAGFWVEVCHSFLISITSFLGRSRSKTLMEEIVVEAYSGCRKVCAT